MRLDRLTLRPVVLVAPVLVAALLLAGCASSSGGNAATAGTSAPSSSAGGTTVAGATTGTTAVPGSASGSARARPSKGCGTSTVGAADRQKHTLTVADVERYYLVTTPEEHDGSTPLPLVVDFHGLAEGAELHAGMTDYSALANEEGFVVVFPHGTGQPVKWDANTASNPNNDVTYVDQVLDELGADLCIDTSRVYATGLSYGAIMSSFLTCVRADRFAAVAPVAGLTVMRDCHPSRPMPAITFHGTADPILKFNGGVDLGAISGNSPSTTVAADLNGPGYPTAVKEWAARNGCDPQPTDTHETSSIVKRTYSCPDGADVELYIVIDGGHSWPGSEFSQSIANIVGPTTMEIDATKLSWEFFQRFQLP